ncbi:MerR family transcriptional regulator [Pyruvatibacter mobilis]|uniref:MerR family transcriptional regulator n=1 Tax=Pyruvatibacter mobilis TaxID=1712261 RepID=UPI003BACAB68
MFTIGKLAKQSGVKVQTVRYYEQIGLMPPVERSAGNQRLYTDAHAERLGFIRHARELGFPLEAIRTLLDLSDSPDKSCAEADEIARARLAEVESRIARLEALKTELTRMIAQCAHGTAADCRVIEVLAATDHTFCASDDHQQDAAPKLAP